MFIIINSQIIGKSKITKFIESIQLNKDVFRLYLYQVCTLFLGIICSIIIARTLGPAGKGKIDLFYLLMSFISEIGILGFGSGLFYYMVNKNEPVGAAHGTALGFSLILGFLSFVIGMCGISLWHRLFAGLDNWMIYICFALSPVIYYQLICLNLITGINKVVYSYLINFVCSISYLIFLSYFYFKNSLSVEKIIIIILVMSFVTIIFNFIILYKRDKNILFEFALAIKSTKYGLVVYLGIVSNVLLFKVDQLMINYWIGTDAVGIYTVSTRWAEMLFLLDNALIAAYLYRISSGTANESYVLSQRLFKVQLVISCVFAALLAIISYPMVFYFYGESYKGAVYPLIILIPGVVAWSATKVLSNFLVYNQKLGIFLTTLSISGLLINVLFNILFINILNWGIIGAAAASSVSYTMVAISVILKTATIKHNNAMPI